MRYHPNTRNITGLAATASAMAAMCAPLWTSPAQAHEWCPPARVSSSAHSTLTTTTATPYAVPLATLDGRTLATYIAQHHIRDVRLDGVR